MRITSVVTLFPDLPQTELVSWVERGWVRPRAPNPTGFRRLSTSPASA
jgi:hypothetical protein